MPALSSQTREEKEGSQPPSSGQQGLFQSDFEFGTISERTGGTSAVSMDTGPEQAVPAVSTCGEEVTVMGSGEGGGVLIAVGIGPREQEEEEEKEEEKVQGEREGEEGEVGKAEDSGSKGKPKIRRRNFDLYRSRDEEEDS